jgi:hypothetical protein
MNPRIPDDPDDLRRIADELLATAIPDDLPATNSVCDVVELIARGVLENALENADDPDTGAPVVHFCSVVFHSFGADTRDSSGERELGGVELSEHFTCRGNTTDALARYLPSKRDEFLALFRIVSNEAGRPFAVIVLMGGVKPDEAGDEAGEPFIIAANAQRQDDGEMTSNAGDGTELLENEHTPDDLRQTLEALLDMARRRARA